MLTLHRIAPHRIICAHKCVVVYICACKHGYGEWSNLSTYEEGAILPLEVGDAAVGETQVRISLGT